MMGMGYGFGLIETLFPILFLVVFGLAIGTIIVTLGKSAVRGMKNNAAPRLSVPARAVSRREAYHSRGDRRGWTQYFVTFEFESGDRMELEMEGEQYGMIVEDDQGQLTFQGSRFIAFNRSGRT